MTGLIWLVQIVQYPLFSFVDRDHYSDFQNFHIIRTGLFAGFGTAAFNMDCWAAGSYLDINIFCVHDNSYSIKEWV